MNRTVTLLDQPVEAAQLAAGDLDLRQRRAVLTDASEPQSLALLRAVVDRDLADDGRKEVTELLIIAAVFRSHLTVQAAFDHLIGMGITGDAGFVSCHSFTVLTFLCLLLPFA